MGHNFPRLVYKTKFNTCKTWIIKIITCRLLTTMSALGSPIEVAGCISVCLLPLSIIACLLEGDFTC